MLLCFNKICTQILLQILGYSFCTESHIFGGFLPNAVAIKSFKNHVRKSCSALAPKMLVKLIPVVNFNNIFSTKAEQLVCRNFLMLSIRKRLYSSWYQLFGV